jgi:hypothetical protein
VSKLVDEWRTADMTATLTHIAGLLESLPLDAYRDALAAEIREAASLDTYEDEAASLRHRRARRGALLAAVSGAKDFITGMQDALQHNRAVSRALELETSIREGQLARGGVVRPPVVDHPAVLASIRTLHPRTGNLLRDTFPGARKALPATLEEAVPDDIA